MKERVLAKNRTSATPPQAIQANSPLLHQRPLTSELSESVGSNSNISKELGGIQPKIIRRSLNWQNITVEAPSRGNGMSLPGGGIQRQQEEAGAVIGNQISADSVQKSPLELSNSTISTDLLVQKPFIARAPFNGRNIPVEAPSRGNGMSLPGGIQRQQEEPGVVSDERVSADSVQKSPLESSNSTISTDLPAQKPFIVRAPFNGRNIPVEAPPRSAVSSTYPGGIQPLETTGVKEQEESTESLQMQPQGAIQAKSSESEPQEKEEQNKELVQTKLTVGAPGDKYEQEADSMAAKVMRMPDSAIQQPIQRQTGEETEAVQMQPLVNSITPLVQRLSGEEEEVQMKSGLQRTSDGSSQASDNVENQLAGSKGGGSPLPDDVRNFMEPRFGADFSSVRVHTDSNAVQMNRELGAQAFAHGSDIYYGAGKSPGKNELTAHELTHTVQQGGALPTKSVAQQEKKENKLQAKADAIQANKDKSADQTNASDFNNVRTGGRPLEKSDRQPTENQSAQPLTPVERFKQRLRGKALAQLYENDLHILRVQAKYQKNSDQNQDNRDQNQKNSDQNQDNTEASEPPQDIIRDREPITIVVTAQRIKAKDPNQDNTEALGRLRQVVAADERLESAQKKLENSSQEFQVRLRVQTFRETNRAAQGGGPNAAGLQAQLDQNQAKLNEIKQVRYTLLQLYPASGVLRAGDVKETNTDTQLLATLNDRFENIRSNIQVAIKGIESGDIRPELLESVVAETLKETPEADIAAVTKYLENKRQQENTFRFFGFLAEIGLTVAAIFTGGFLGAVMAALASAMGIGQAAYEFEQADDLNTVAKTGQAGGNQLLADPDVARFNYIMGWVNLVLAGIDGGLAVREGTQLLVGARAAERLANQAGVQVLFRLPQEKLVRLQEAMRLEKAKDPRATQLLASLRSELGEDFSPAYNLFKNSELEVLDDAQASRILGGMARPKGYLVLEELVQRRNAVISECGEGLVIRAEQNLRYLLNDADIFIRIKEEGLERMLRDGRYKTIIEAGAEEAIRNPTGSTAQAITRRRNGEEKLFGYSQDFPLQKRPVYGYVARQADSPEAGIAGEAYGNIAIKLKPATKTRSTFTADDSLFGPDRMTRQPSMFDNPNIASFVSLEDIANVDDLQQKIQRIASAQNLQELTEIKQQHYYFEVQVHDQVKFSDVAEIIYKGTQPSETIIQLARERGITLVVR